MSAREELRTGLLASLTILNERLSGERDGDERWQMYLEACDKLEAHFRYHGWTPPPGWPATSTPITVAERPNANAVDGSSPQGIAP